MSLPEFNQLAVQEFTLIKRDRNVSGDFSILSSTTGLKGWIDFGNHFITTPEGEKKEATAIVFLKDDCGILIDWDYWMINQTIPNIRNDLEVIKIDPIDNPLNPYTGNIHHFEIHVR